MFPGKFRSWTWLAILLCSLGAIGFAARFFMTVHAQKAQPLPEGDGPWVVRAYYDDPRMLDLVVSWTEPWEVVGRERSDRDRAYIVVEVRRAGYERLLEAGFEVEVDVRLTDALNRPNVRLQAQDAGIPGYPCYRTVEETLAAMAAIAAAHPELSTWIDAGDSWEKTTPGGGAGYDLMVLRLTNAATPGPKPRLFVASALHAREYAPAELAARFAEYLVEQYGADADVTWLLDYHEIHLLLQANPDGRKQAETGLSWRKNTNENYCSPVSNYRGADLNRNFEFQWGCCGGSSADPCSLTYRGPSPASEPETQAIQFYVRSLFPDQRADSLDAAAPLTTTGVFVDLHSYGELVLWPWGFDTAPPPNGTALQTLGRKLAYFGAYWPQQAAWLYRTEGTSDTFVYGDLGVAAYTIELGTTFFQECSVFENTILPDNLPTLLYAAKVVRTPYVTPSGPDTLDVTVAPTRGTAGESLLLTARLDDTRYSNQNGGEPVQEIAAAECYLDVPPWLAAATTIAQPMLPTDGRFDEPVEKVQATLDTSDVPAGRHIAFVRGQDTAGSWGALSAAFFYVLDPVLLEAETIAQTVRAGTSVTYTLTITNAGRVTDTFSLTLEGNRWAAAIPAAVGPLGAGAGVAFGVTVDVPSDALAGEQDRLTVTATSTSDTDRSASIVLETSVRKYHWFLPLAVRLAPL
jgi:carboxypeptidase T